MWIRASATTRRWVFALLAVLLAVFLTLGAIEIAMRRLDYPFSADWIPSENALARFDEQLGWSYIPNHEAVQAFGDARRRVAMYFDEIGCRVPSADFQLDRSAISVLFVGGSFTMGHGVAYEESFVGQLSQTPGFPQVVNLGVQGYGTDQALLALQRHMSRFRAHAVVYTYVAAHSQRNTQHDRRYVNPRACFLGTKPRFALRPDGSVSLSHRPRRYEDMNHLRLWDFLQLRGYRYEPGPSMDLTRALVRQMKRYVEGRGALFVLVLWTPSHHQQPPQVAVRLFPIHDLYVIDLGFEAPSGWDEWRIPGDGHPDPRAHRYVARVIAEHLHLKQ